MSCSGSHDNELCTLNFDDHFTMSYLPVISLRHVLVRRSSAAANLRKVLDKELDGIRAAGTWKSERVITSPQASAIKVQEAGDRSVLNFCANNYLGLSVSVFMWHFIY